MSKVKITFNLPEDRSNFLLASHADDMASVLWDFLNNGHRKYKEQNNNLFEGIKQAQKDIYEALEEEGVNIDKLWV